MLGAVITVSPDAEAEAAARDQARAAAQRRPAARHPGTDQGQHRGARAARHGWLARAAGRRVRTTAFLVTRLRAAGAVILGKANLSEWANFRSTASTSGWSTLGGQAANPHALDRNPSGSSSGSAVAVAAGPGPGRGGHRDRRLDRLPGQRVRRGRHQAHPRPGQPARHRAHLGPAGHGGPDGPDGGGRRHAARRAGRARSRPTRPPRPPPGSPPTTPTFLDPGALDGARIGRVAGRLRPGRRRLPGPCWTARSACSARPVPTVADPVELPGAAGIEAPEFTALLHEFKHDIKPVPGRAARPPPAGRWPSSSISTSRYARSVLAHFGQETVQQAEATSGDPARPG